MTSSIFGSLLGMLDKGTVAEVAHALGQPESSVARGMESSIAALLGGMASKSEDPDALRRILDTVPGTAGPVSWSQIAGGIADPNSSLMAAGKRVLSALFGRGESDITNGIGRESGLSSGVISTLLTMAAPVVMSFLNKLVLDGGITMSGLGGILKRESATIRSALPSGLSELLWPGAASPVSHVVAQEAHKGRSFGWVPILALAGLGLSLVWFFGHSRRPSIAEVVPPSATTGMANRLAAPMPATVLCSLPTNIALTPGGVEARLLSFVQNPDTKPAEAAWFGIDQLTFDSGSATPRSGAEPLLSNIAAILTSCPNVRLTIAGFADNVGNPESNLLLSQNRANTVVAQLVSHGVSRDRLTPEGHGAEFAATDNPFEEVRAQNRRVAMRVTQK